MFTAESIRSVEFQKSGMSGVKASDVYAFVDEIANDFEKLEKQNEQLVQKLQVLADCVEEYRKSEDTVKTAIIAAQKTADQLLRDAKEKSTAIVEEKTKAVEDLERTSTETAEKLISESQAKARELLDEATMRANQIVAQAEQQAKSKRDEIDKMVNQQMLTYNYIKDEVKNFKEKIIDSYKTHLDTLTNVPMTSRALEVYAEKEQNSQNEKKDEPNKKED